MCVINELVIFCKYNLLKQIKNQNHLNERKNGKLNKNKIPNYLKSKADNWISKFTNLRYEN